MEIQKIENFKIPNAKAHKMTQDELQREFNYYRAQKILETMLVRELISIDEYDKITALNRKSFSPLLAEIMA